MNVADVLRPAHVDLGLRAASKAEAVDLLLARLDGDPRISDGAALRQAVIGRDAPALQSRGCSVCIAHGRTSAAKQLVFAAGRADEPIPDVAGGIRLVFVAGIPAAFDSQYLRLVGGIVRVCSDSDRLAELLAAPDGAEFVSVLSEAVEG